MGNKNQSQKQKPIQEEDLLKSLGLLENDLSKGFPPAASGDDDSSSETEEETEEETETPVAKGSDKKSKGTAAMPKKLKQANGALSTQGDSNELSKGFSDNVTEETREVLDTTPFFIDLRDFLDGQSASLSDLRKSLAEIEERTDRDDKIIKSLAGAVVQVGREVARQGAFLNELGARLNMPVTKAPRSVLAKSEVADRNFGSDADEVPERDPNAISKAEFNAALDLLISENKVDHRAVIAYETSGGTILPDHVRNVVAQKALSLRASNAH